MERIIRNSVRCLNCSTDIESKHRHDFVSCPCGTIAVDGGTDYLRRAGSVRSSDWVDTSIIEEKPDETASS